MDLQELLVIMDYIYLSVMGSLVGTIAIVLVSLYLYIMYRKRYMGFWVLGWLVFILRYAALDSGVFVWKSSALGLTIYQLLTYISVLTIVYSTYGFISKPFNRHWLYGAAITLLASTVLNFQAIPFIYKILLPIYTCCFAGIWVGLTFIRHRKLQNSGRLITGYAYLFLSLINFSTPFIMHGSWLLPWGYALGGILRLIIAIGTLMLYFEKTRTELMKKEAQYRQLLENAIDIIYCYQLFPEKKLDYVSPSVLTVTGYAPAEFYADSSLSCKLVHPDDYSVFRNFINQIPTSIELPLTIRLIKKDKTTLWIEQKCAPIYAENGQLLALEGVIRDVTYRKKLEQMTFDRMNMVGSMAAVVAHEIRNPMTTVRGYLQLLGGKKTYQTDREKIILMIEELDRANNIIHEYLSLSHQKRVSLKKCSLNHIIDALSPLVRADGNSSKVQVTLELNKIPELLLDENEIRQLLLNLVRNGIEAMPSGGNLIIRTTSVENKIILAISDQGSGIPSHILDHLGTPFCTTKDTGTGLGLPICYQIAQRHNAAIKIDTSKQGTTFFVYFTQPGPQSA
ncbi:PAS/PAC sensor signal transduction histidine kinase [Dendrosporobacter quercicolus]|uniref:histidine kinase n=1 Tax=Dendrosporobacter quercicolus TaxID=146817 RepID=A0A1G9YF25_9FIRM|nr:PAS/PAC sensor signal transduction histidine kinase [Dendrosporobacter quercicolus]